MLAARHLRKPRNKLSGWLGSDPSHASVASVVRATSPASAPDRTVTDVTTVSPDPARETRSTAVDVTLFFALAIALCFAIASPMIFGLVPPDMYNVIVPLAQMSPLIAGVLMWLPRRTGIPFREAFAVRARGTLTWTGVGIGVIAAIALVQTSVAVGVGLWPLHPLDQIATAALWIAPVFVMQSIFAIGEEFGWRGWLAGRAAPAWGFWRLSAISGLVWIVWHLPVLAVIGGEGFWNIVIYFAGMLPWAPLLLALRLRSDSVWPAVLTHGGINSVRVFLLESVPDASLHLGIEVLGWVLTIAAAAWLMRGDRRARRRA